MGRMNFWQERGFTLVELLVVISLIGVLAAIAIPRYNSYKAKAFDAMAESDARNFATFLVKYNSDQDDDPSLLNNINFTQFKAATGFIESNGVVYPSSWFEIFNDGEQFIGLYHPNGQRCFCVKGMNNYRGTPGVFSWDATGPTSSSCPTIFGNDCEI